jgi:hypothetical protein
MREEYQHFTENHGSFGSAIKIGPKSHVMLLAEGASRKYHMKSIEILVGIGKDHTASLTMDIEAWEALKSGEDVKVATLKEFRENFL